MKKLLLILICFLFQFSVFCQSGGYDRKRFSFSYNPGYAFPGYFLQKLELGFTVFDFCKININTEQVMTFNEYGETGYLRDKTYGGDILFFKTYKGYYSPIGKYIGFGVNKGAQTKQYFINYTTADFSYVQISSMKTIPITVFSLLTGQNYVVYDRFLLGFGVRWGVVLHQKEWNLQYVANPFFNLGIIF